MTNYVCAIFKGLEILVGNTFYQAALMSYDEWNNLNIIYENPAVMNGAQIKITIDHNFYKWILFSGIEYCIVWSDYDSHMYVKSLAKK